MKVQRHEEGDEREEPRPRTEHQRDTRRQFAEGDEPREERRAWNREALQIRVTQRSRGNGREPAEQLTVEDRRIGEPAELSEALEDEEHADADSQNRDSR